MRAVTVGRIGISGRELPLVVTQSKACESHLPILTGKPGGNFIWTNSRSLLKCLNGAITSRTLSRESTVIGNSSLCEESTDQLSTSSLRRMTDHCKSRFESFDGLFAHRLSAERRVLSGRRTDVLFPRDRRGRGRRQRGPPLNRLLAVRVVDGNRRRAGIAFREAFDHCFVFLEVFVRQVFPSLSGLKIQASD